MSILAAHTIQRWTEKSLIFVEQVAKLLSKKLRTKINTLADLSRFVGRPVAVEDAATKIYKIGWYT